MSKRVGDWVNFCIKLCIYNQKLGYSNCDLHFFGPSSIYIDMSTDKTASIEKQASSYFKSGAVYKPVPPYETFLIHSKKRA